MPLIDSLTIPWSASLVRDELVSFVCEMYEPEDWADWYFAIEQALTHLQDRPRIFIFSDAWPLVEAYYTGDQALINHHDLKQTQAELAYARSRPEAHLDTTFQEIDNAD
jgi:hypothetical protein